MSMSRIDNIRILSLISGAAALALGTAAAAQDGDQSLEQAANDPTASLMAFQLQNYYTPEFHNADGDLNVLQFRAAVPFTFAGIDNIARLTVPYVTSNSLGETGLSDTTLFNLAVFNRPWGRWGVGVVGLIPTGAEGVSAEKWALGPAAGFTARSGRLLWGLFNQNLFTVAGDEDRQDVNISTLQPILSRSLGGGWSVGLSEMTIVYDWEESAFTSLPLGVKLSKLVTFGTTPVQFQASYEHNFYDDDVAPADTFGVIAKILLPSG
jgi:hypothetical protein